MVTEWYAKKRVKCSPCALFLSKNAFFSKKICFKYAGYRPPFNELLYLRTPPVGNNSYLAMLERIFQHSPEATFVKCSKYALFLSKNAFFSKKICVFAFFVVPLQPLSKKKHFRHNMS